MTEQTARICLREKVSVRGITLKWPTCLALRRDRLAVVDGRDLLMSFEDVTAPRLLPDQVVTLGWHPASVQLSSSQRYVSLTAEPGNYVEVWDLHTREPVGAVSGPERVVATFVTFDGRELLVFSRRAGVLEAFALGGKELGFVAPCSMPAPFVFTALTSLEDGGTVLAVGHRFLKGADRLVSLSVRALLASPSSATEAIEAPLATGFTVAGGRGEAGQFVIYCDPAGRKHNGTLTVERTGSREVVEAFAHPAAVHGELSLLAAPTAIALVQPDRVDLVSRGGAHEVQRIPVRIAAIDAGGARLVIVNASGEIERLEFEAAAPSAEESGFPRPGPALVST
jgi:hypothetical protein